MGTATRDSRTGGKRDWSSLRAAFRSVWRWLGVVALVAAGVLLVVKVADFESTGWLALDFKLGAAQRLVDGETLYPPGTSGEYPYPPLWAMLASPLLLLPTLVAQYTACALCAAAFVAALWVIGVRDPFCFAAAIVSGPVVSVSQVGNVSAFVALLLALGYRYNGAPVGLAVALKLYAWPLVLWSAMRRGLRDLALGLTVAAAAVFVPWAAIGFDGIERFVSVVRDVTADQPTYALPTGVGIAVTALALAAMWARRADAVGSFSFAVLAMLAASPVLWGFYFSAVFLPLALRRPRFSAAWLLPLLAVLIEGTEYRLVFFALLVWCGLGAPTLRAGLRRQPEHASVPAGQSETG